MSLFSAQWIVYLCCAFLLMLTATSGSVATSWWSVGITECGKSITTPNISCPNCAKLQQVGSFNADQTRQCQNDPTIRDSLARGARACIIECQYLFEESRWNCSTLSGEHLFGAFVATSITRETGVLNACFAAGAVSAISDDCRNQRIASCPCIIEHPRREDDDGNIIFETCKADFTSASNYFNDFVLDQISEESCEGRVERHNINIGKQLINNERTFCRCHGVSGTCTVQTCYKRLSAESEIGETLFTLYGGAVRVTEIDGQIVNANPNSDPYGPDDIIYKDDSPDFCQEDSVLGTVGVAHRLCDPNSNNRNACASTCCDHGHYSVTKIKPVEECRFVWCCDIECTIMRNDTITEHRCNP